MEHKKDLTYKYEVALRIFAFQRSYVLIRKGLIGEEWGFDSTKPAKISVS